MGCCGRHHVCHLLLVILAFFAFVAAAAINFLNSYNISSLELGLFESNVADLADKYRLDITPASWTFLIWSVIFIYQLIWFLYVFTTLCRRGMSEDELMYYSPTCLHPAFFIIYILNMGINVAWLFLWDREYLVYSAILLAACTATAYLCIIISMSSLSKNAKELVKMNQRGRIIEIILFVHNGLGAYASWCSIATLLSVGHVLAYELDFDVSLTGTIMLCVLIFELVIYACTDMIFFEKHFRYLYTPYMVLLVALTGILLENWDEDSPNCIMNITLLACGGFLFLAKIAVSIVRSRRDPIYTSESRHVE